MRPRCAPRPAAEILATHGTETNRFGRVPLIVTKTYGAGKILFMGTDGAWRWRKGVEDKYHYRFWGQVVRWMAYQRNMAQGEKMRLFYSPDRPRTGEVAHAECQRDEPRRASRLRDGAVIAQITAPSGKTSSVRLMPAGEEAWGLFTGIFTPSEPGDHKSSHLRGSGSNLVAAISVQGTSQEKRGQPARLDVLREIAQLTRGKLMPSADPAAVVAAVAALPQPKPQERRLQLWAHPLWAGFLVLLLGVFWAGRKAAGAF